MRDRAIARLPAATSLPAADRCHVVRPSRCSRPRLAARATLFATLLATLVPSGRGAAQQAPAVSAVSSSRTVVFRDVTVIDVAQGRRLPAQTVIVAGTRIRRMGPVGAVPVPAGAQVVNARGKYLIPGLWDMHAHPATFGADTSTTVEARLTPATDVFYPLFVAYGVTGVRDPGAAVPLATFNRWKQEIAAGTRVGPRLFVAGPSIHQCDEDGRDRWVAKHTMCVSTTGEARLVVDFLNQAGADFIKPYDLPKPLYFAMLAEARRLGMPFGGHVDPGFFGEASDSGARFFDHWGAYPCAVSCADSAARLRRNGTWLVLNAVGTALAVFPDQFEADLRRYYPDSLVRELAPWLRSLKATHDSLFRDLPSRPPASIADFKAAVGRSADLGTRVVNLAAVPGTPILAATDFEYGAALPGQLLHDALVNFVLGGLTPLEALQTATLNPAKAIGATDSLGTVEAGKLADLVLLDADPLADITNTMKIRAVMANGRYFDHAALEALRAQAERAAHRHR